ncbi:GNAT family N-acetyltransferase [Ramlibacter sp. AN1133]|uniref:GNAT family N-acetyltransferase n=1 Tax=Ramlibacter sp. AN1133 TaxID=3133429 RepID=UPI0030BDD8EF
MVDAAAQLVVATVPEVDRVLLASMLRDYLEELGAESKYPYLDLYWRESGRYAYWIKVSGDIAGFALIRQTEGGTNEVAEFFVGGPWRRRGVGRAAAKALFAAHHGLWQVRSYPLSPASESFWEKVVPSNAQRVRDEQCSVFFFTVGAAV